MARIINIRREIEGEETAVAAAVAVARSQLG